MKDLSFASLPASGSNSHQVKNYTPLFKFPLICIETIVAFHYCSYYVTVFKERKREEESDFCNIMDVLACLFVYGLFVFVFLLFLSFFWATILKIETTVAFINFFLCVLSLHFLSSHPPTARHTDHTFHPTQWYTLHHTISPHKRSIDNYFRSFLSIHLPVCLPSVWVQSFVLVVVVIAVLYTPFIFPLVKKEKRKKEAIVSTIFIYLCQWFFYVSVS